MANARVAFECFDDLRVHLRQENFVEDRSLGRLHALAVALFDFRRAAADENEVFAGLHRAGVKQFDRRALDHPIGRERPGGDAAQLNQCNGRELGHTMRK